MTRRTLAAVCVLLAACATTPDTAHTGVPRSTTTSYDVGGEVFDWTPTPPTTTTTVVVVPATTSPPVPVTVAEVVPAAVAPPTPARVGECGGWQGLVAAYFPAEQVATGCRILMCESNGNPNAVSPTNDHGLWQINVVHRNSFDWSRRYDPDVNTAFARKLWGEQGWNPWACY